ncbi:unnamed protein product [Ambrosiozyma monospora]|uniref:Unnamed protein product n=1 Tax=Ambrosiozyma monospora TaxID=43982 RepID=A0ACB5U0R3_AMBMO|nr:unnamed protein product [Ambrosiozyma monospora]
MKMNNIDEGLTVKKKLPAFMHDEFQYLTGRRCGIRVGIGDENEKELNSETINKEINQEREQMITKKAKEIGKLFLGSGTKVLKVAYDDEFRKSFGGVGNLLNKFPKSIVMKVYSASDAMDLYYDKEARLADKSDVWFQKPTYDQYLQSWLDCTNVKWPLIKPLRSTIIIMPIIQ